MPLETLLPVLAVLAVFAALLGALWLMKRRGIGFTPRVFAALGLGIALGVGIQLALGRGSDAALWALDWIAVVGQGYIALLKMLVMPLVFVAIVGAFTRTKVTENLGRISAVVLAPFNLVFPLVAAALFEWTGGYEAFFVIVPAFALLSLLCGALCKPANVRLQEKYGVAEPALAGAAVGETRERSADGVGQRADREAGVAHRA